MKILIVGHYNSVFIEELSTQLFSFDNAISVDILDIYDAALYHQNSKISFGRSIRGKKRLVRNLLLIRNLLAFKKYAKKNLLQYDACNIHYLDARYSLIYKTFKKISAKLIVTTYGSDFYKFKKYGNLLKKFYNNADAITFANEQTRDDFSHYYKDIVPKKLKICRFGLGNLNQIEKLKRLENNKVFYKAKAGLKQNKVIVTIGYSSNPNSRQTEIINQLSNLEKSILEKIFFVFPMTYGGFKENIANTEMEIRKLNQDYLIIKDFLTNEQLGYLRLATDVMIHLPISDQLSGAMQENLFSGNIVITGNWLPYTIFDNNGVNYYKIENLNEINLLLTNIVKNLENYQSETKENAKRIWNLSSWENNIKSWIDLYKK